MRSSALRPFVAAAILVVLTLSGVGRSAVFAEAASPPLIQIAGVTIQTCHTDGSKPIPDDAGGHDCCDACMLCAPVSLPDGALLAAPARVEHFTEHAAAVTWAPALARVATPRLSQGPPAA